LNPCHAHNVETFTTQAGCWRFAIETNVPKPSTRLRSGRQGQTGVAL
jgi:hypothetical protein